MKTLAFSMFTVLCFFSTYAQVTVPYYKSFNFPIGFNFKWWNYDADHNHYVPNHGNELQWGAEMWRKRVASSYSTDFYRVDTNGGISGTGPFRDCKPLPINFSNELDRTTFVKSPGGRLGNSIKLTVQDYYDKASGIHVNCGKNSRNEIVFRPYHEEGTDYYYAWSFFVPLDFQDEIDNTNGNPEGAGNIIAQWHEPYPFQSLNSSYGGNQQPPFFFIYLNEPTALDNFRNIEIGYGLKSTNVNDRKFITFNDAIEKGKWNDVVLRMKWSSDVDGLMELWINGVKLDDLNDEFKGANMYKNTLGIGQPNKFKIGQYRLGQWNQTSIFLNEFRVGSIYESVNLRTSFITPLSTITLTSNDMKIHCHEVVGATYDFYFVNENKIITSQVPSLDLGTINWIKFNKQYEVKVRVHLYDQQNTTELFSPSIFVKTPHETRIIDALKDYTFYNKEMIIRAYEIEGVSQYMFYFVNEDKYQLSNTCSLDLANIDWIKFNKEYEVKVRPYNNCISGSINICDYGPATTIFTPAQTSLKPTDCNILTLATGQKTIHAFPVEGVERYKFKIANLNQYPESEEASLDLSQFSWFVPNGYYEISVRAMENCIQDANGLQPCNYGKVCKIGSSSSNKMGSISKVYPNPLKTSEILTIENSIKSPFDVKIINVVGQIVYAKKHEGNIVQIKLPNYVPKGVYNILIINKNKIVSKALTIN